MSKANMEIALTVSSIITSKLVESAQASLVESL